MSLSLEALTEFAACAARARYISVAAYSWVMYDWFVTMGQEINFVWRRPGAWPSKLIYAFTRYQGLAIVTLNMVVAVNSGWSHDFCHTYFWLLGFAGTAHTFAVQSALLLRIYVMYHQSRRVLIPSCILFACEVISLSVIVAIDIHHFTSIPALSGISGCWSTELNPHLGLAIWWICLSFETYLCALVLGPAYQHWQSSKRQKRSPGAVIWDILIRDSLVWYASLAGCLMLNAIAWTTNSPKLVLIGVPLLNSSSTIGGSRLMLNLRGAYFTSLSDPQASMAGLGTKGTVGLFQSSKIGEATEDCGASISMGVWSNEDVQRSGNTPCPPSPPPTPQQDVILLKPVPLGKRKATGLADSWGVERLDDRGDPVCNCASSSGEDRDEGKDINVFGVWRVIAFEVIR